MKRLKLIILIQCILLATSSFIYSQNEDIDENAAPQILTSDLLRKQIIHEPTKVISFVIIDDDKIEKVEINGEKQDFEPANTVAIDKKYTFKKGRTLITVVATDERGNQRTKNYLVGYDITDDESSGEGRKESGDLMFVVNFKAAYENDDNPTSDLSSPIKLGDLEIEGVIPDEEQPDTRITLNASLLVMKADLYGFVGIDQTDYSKAENDFLNSKAIFMGAGYSVRLSDTSRFLISYMFMDVNVGGEDFSQNHAISPGLLFDSKDADGSYKDFIGIDYTLKNFADKQFDAGTEVALKWTYESTDPEKLDKYYRVFAYGTVNEGTEVSEYTFLQMDFDWYNRWESGLLFDIGTGLQHRQYKNDVPLTEETPLGSKRVDIPFRFSTGLGWQFNPQWKAVYNYKYQTNLSNKAPWVRNIHGLTINGQF